MEIINNRQDPNQPPRRSWAQHAYLGVALIAVGAIWMLYNFKVIGYQFFDIFFSWQMLLVVIGGYLLTVKKWVAGSLVALVGIFFVATDILGIHIPLNKVVLPLICIVAGLAVLLTRNSRG